MSAFFLRIFAMLAMLGMAKPGIANPEGSFDDRCAQAHALFDGAEQWFQQPSDEWFDTTQTSLREEVERVGHTLEAGGSEYAEAWKSHLRWHLLETNLHSRSVNLKELEVVRRWMYSNRKGLEDPLFAQLRQRMDAYLDAVFTFSHDNLQTTFDEKVVLARQHCLALAEDASLTDALALGRTLGWFERTGQLAEETAQTRSLLSLPNIQIVLTSELAHRLLSVFEMEVKESVKISSTETSPPTGILRRPRTLHVRGTATTIGSTLLTVVPNSLAAEISLVYRGTVNAYCRADAGPAVLNVKTTGPVMAVKPFYLSPAGLQVGETEVHPEEATRLSSVTAQRAFVKRIAQRRANQPKSKSFMQSSGRDRTIALLQENLDEKVDSVLAEIKSEFLRMKESMSGFQEVFAPVVREGAQPRVHSLFSSNAGIVFNIEGRRREHFGAVTPFESDSLGGDFQARIHVSYFNNTAETILGGKTLSDAFLMRYAKILQAELPLPLMVHSRSTSWAVTTAKHRPLELRIPESNRFKFVMRIEAVQIDGQTYPEPTTATVDYLLEKNEFGDYQLSRVDEVELTTELSTVERLFLQQKLNAFFAPVLDGGGVVIPEGGVLGAMNDIQPAGVQANNNWIAIGVNIPATILEELIRIQSLSTISAAEPSS